MDHDKLKHDEDEHVHHHHHDHNDEGSDFWQSFLGEHLHHGYYDAGTLSKLDYHAAQVRMMEEMLRFAGILDDPAKLPKRIVDVGCGVGGSSRYLAKKFNAQVEGITLSKAEVEKAQALTQAQGLADKVSFQVADAMEQPFPDEQFDLVWSLQSAEHIPDKQKLMSEIVRVAAPGATIIIVAWCHRELLPTENTLRADETQIMDMIIDTFHLPPWCPPSEYVKLAESFSLENIKTADWSENVAPFWPAILYSVFTEEGLKTLLQAGTRSIKQAQIMTLTSVGMCSNLLKLVILSCRKPE